MRKFALCLLALLVVCSQCYAANQNLTQKTEDTAPSLDDIIYTVNDPGGTPADKKVTLTNALKLSGWSPSGTEVNFNSTTYTDGLTISDVNVTFDNATIKLSNDASVDGTWVVGNLNTGQGAYELYSMNQDVETTDAVTFATVNTGQGANELYDMDQNVTTTSDVTFNELTTSAVNITGTEAGSIGLADDSLDLHYLTVSSDPYLYLDGELISASLTPAGNDTEIQFNDSGSFGASSSLVWDGSMLEIQGSLSASENLTLDDVMYVGGEPVWNFTDVDDTAQIQVDGTSVIDLTDTGVMATFNGDVKIDGSLTLSSILTSTGSLYYLLIDDDGNVYKQAM